MTPEQLKVLRDHYAAKWRFGIVEVLDECIEIAEREAKLREACRTAVSQLWSVIEKEAEHPLIPVYEQFAEILETKGGET